MSNDKVLSEIKNLVPDTKTPNIYLDLLKSQIMKPDKDGKARSNEDLLLFMYVAKKTGLDPLTRQIYAVFRWDSKQGREVMSIQTGIDGLRLIAQRTGEYGGQEETKFETDLATGKLISATVTVIKIPSSTKQPIRVPARAKLSEYMQTKNDGSPMGLWAKMPETMLEKCAEAKALRKAFPAETAGIYAEEEYPLPTITQDLPPVEKSETKVESKVDITNLRKEIKK